MDRSRLITLPVLLSLLLTGFSSFIIAGETNDDSADKEGTSVIVQAAFINIHTGPGRGYPIFYIAERGETIRLLKQRTTWIKIHNANGKEGWISSKDIDQTTGETGQQLTANYPSFDKYINRRWEVGIMFGDFGGTDVITGYTGYHFTKNLSVEVALSENFGNFSNGKAATISLVHQPFPRWRVSPFFSLGAGMRKTEPRSNLVQTEDRTDDMLIVGAGLRVYLTDKFILRLQYKNNTVLTSRDDDQEVEEWKIGLSAFF
jgi:uncharacterized protein YgiM (DUF1202 family)